MKKLLVMACIAIASMSAGNLVAQNTAKTAKKAETEQTCKAKCPEAKTECCEPKAKEPCVQNQECSKAKQDCRATENCKGNKKCPQVTEKKTTKTKK